MEKNACGIVSYAGLSKETLLSLGKAAFAQAQPPVPKRFDAFLPLFPVELIQNMDYVGFAETRGARVAPSGFSIDPAEYHRKLYAQLPELYAEDNYARNFDYEGRYVGRGVFAVDRAWVDHFPQYQPFMGEKLMIYLIGGGFQAVAVPESVFPRGGGVLEAAEAAMQITQRVELFNQYARARIATGDKYEPESFQAGFLNTTGLTVTTLTQKEIGRVLQDLSMMKSLQSDTVSVGLYTENARRAERVGQYVPMRYACDLFALEAVDKHTARLAQLYSADGDFISDMWIPYQDFSAYVDKRTMTLDVRRLCEGYQIAPRYDPETLGGRYPDTVRVAVVRDRAIRLMVSEVINNPAYGDGMSPQGMIGRQVYIADSREMIRQRRLALEEVQIAAENTTLPPEAYRKCLSLAVLQEHKGRLVDAMYRRETVLSQINPETPVYAKACALLNERVNRLAELVGRESAQSGMSQMSGYDADIDYLRRKQLDREGVPEETAGAKPIAFARDALREQSIESGYAMRAGLLRLMYQDAALPEPPPEQTVGEDDSEDEAGREPLPPIPADARKVTVEPVPAKIEAVAPNDKKVPVKQPEEAEIDAAKGAEISPKTPEGNPAAADGEAVQKQKACDAEISDTPEATDATMVSPAHDEVQETATKGEDALAETAADRSVGDQTDASGSIELDADGAETVDSNETGTGDENQTQGNMGETFAGEKPADSDEAAAPHKRVSLRELTDRCTVEPETPPAEPAPAQPPAEEPPKPKLAYILRRGSEETASKSFNRMSELLRKRGQ